MNIEGEKKIPAVVHEEWDEKDQKIKTVRRNVLTGELDAEKFTELVNSLDEDPEDLPAILGFDEKKEFDKYYIENEEDSIEVPEETEKYVIDSLEDIVSTLFDQTKGTVDKDYLCFSYKGSTVLVILCDNELRELVGDMQEILKESDESATEFMKKVVKNSLELAK